MGGPMWSVKEKGKFSTLDILWLLQFNSNNDTWNASLHDSQFLLTKWDALWAHPTTKSVHECRPRTLKRDEMSFLLREASNMMRRFFVIQEPRNREQGYHTMVHNGVPSCAMSRRLSCHAHGNRELWAEARKLFRAQPHCEDQAQPCGELLTWELR